jgi:hypothetical protein
MKNELKIIGGCGNDCWLEMKTKVLLEEQAALSYKQGREEAIEQCIELLEENLRTEEYFGVYGEVKMEEFKKALESF